MSGEWHSLVFRVIYESLGWFAFVVWSGSFYPQAILNYQRKSVVGLNFDFLAFNLTKHTSYLIFNASLFFSAVVQRQYHEKYGPKELIPVSASDVAFSVHAVLLTVYTVYQALIYERAHQRVSLLALAITALAWGLAAILFVYAFSTGSWLWLVTRFNYIQLAFTSFKYIPQVYMNYQRRSTIGWSINNILLDISGGLASLLQMFVFSIDQRSVENFSGNLGKLGLSLETIVFDVIFIVQHYALYPERGGKGKADSGDDSLQPLVEEGGGAEVRA